MRDKSVARYPKQVTICPSLIVSTLSLVLTNTSAPPDDSTMNNIRSAAPGEGDLPEKEAHSGYGHVEHSHQKYLEDVFVDEEEHQIQYRTLSWQVHTILSASFRTLEDS